MPQTTLTPIRRLLAGTLLFGVSSSIGMLVGQNAVSQRFMGNLKLLITMPVSKGAHVLGSLAFSSILETIAATFLVVFGFLAGVHIDIALGLAPSLALAVLSVVGLTMFVVSFAPSLQAENILTSMLSLVLAALSPAYSTTEQAPLLLRLLGWVSPPEVRRRWNRQIAVWTD